MKHGAGLGAMSKGRSTGRAWATPTIIAILWGIAIVLAQAEIFAPERFNPGGLPLLWRFVQASVHPELEPEFLSLTLKATLTTLAYAICGTCLSTVLGIGGGLVCSQIWWLTICPHWSYRNVVWLTIRGLLAIPRAIHEMVWGLFLINLWGLDPLTALVALTIPYGAIVAKVFSEILDETPREPLIALLNSGVAPLPALLYGLVPQAASNLLSYTLYRFECALRSATILGMIGAGGLGYEILLSLQSLRYEQLWTLFYALILLNGAVEFSPVLWCHRLNLSTILGMIGLCLFGFWGVNADFGKLWSPQTAHQLTNLLQIPLLPTWTATQVAQLLPLCVQTLGMSLLAMAIASLGGLLLSFGAARNLVLPRGLLNPHPQGLTRSGLQGWAVFLSLRLVLLCCRAIPAPIWALVTVFMVFPGMLPGAIALGLHNLGVLGRLMADTNENLDPAPLAALQAQGTPRAQLFLYGVLPMNSSQFWAYGLYRWEVCIRETVTIGLVGAGGLGLLLNEQISSFDAPGAIVTLSCFVILTFGVDTVSAAIRQGKRGKQGQKPLLTCS